MELTKEQLIELIAEGVKSTVKELGIGEVEKKHLHIPQETIEKDNEYEKMSPSEKIKTFLKSVITKNVDVIKALGGSVDTEGGFLVPTDFRKEIIKGIEEKAIMRPLVRVMPVSSRTGEIPKVTSKPSFSIGSENVAFTESDPVFGQIAYAVQRLDVFVPISNELLADSAIDLAMLIRDLFVERYVVAEDTIMTVGAGNIVGIQKDTSITASAVTTFDYDTIVDAFYSLPKPYRTGAVFMTSSLGIKALRKVKDTNGNPILVPASNGGEFTIFGKRVIENPYMEDTLVDPDGSAGSGDEYYTADLIIGDMKNAILFDRGEFAIASTSEGDAFKLHQTWFKSWNRIDFKVALPEAFIKITGIK